MPFGRRTQNGTSALATSATATSNATGPTPSLRGESSSRLPTKSSLSSRRSSSGSSTLQSISRNPAKNESQTSIPRRTQASAAQKDMNLENTPTLHNTGTGSIPQSKPHRSAHPPNGANNDRRTEARLSTPSLISGSSASTQESPKARVLRRKPSVIGRYMAQRQQQKGKLPAITHPLPHLASEVTDQPPVALDIIQNELYESSQSRNARRDAHTTPIHTNIPHEDPAQRDEVFNRTTPFSEMSATPSLPSANSPGAFSHATTQTSLTSYSPLPTFSPVSGMQHFSSPGKTRGNTAPNPRDSERHGQSPSKAQTRTRSGSWSTVPRRPPVPEKDPPKASKSRINCPPIHPPELAHLKLDPNNSSSNLSSSPPRPSRDGITSPGDDQSALTIVQSNLVRSNTGQPVRSSSSKYSGGENKSATPVSSSAIRVDPVHRGKSAPVPKSERSLPQLDTSSNITHAQNSTKSDQSPTAKISAEPVKSKSRFGFFTRKAKTDTPPKQPRKGPVAGTGHEGYGKHSFRGKNASSTSVQSGQSTSSSSKGPPQFRTRRTSSGTSGQSSDIDDFLQQRLTPVYLRGDGNGSDVDARASGSAIEDDAPFSPPNGSPQTSQTSGSEADLNGKSEKAQPPSQIHHTGRLQQISKTSKDDVLPAKSLTPMSAELAQKKQKVDQIDLPVRPSTSGSSRPRRSSDYEFDDGASKKKSNWSLFPKSGGQHKASGKWNFFQRSKPSENEQDPFPSREVDLIPRNQSARTPAHYMMHESVEPVDVEDLERLMREADAACAGDRSSTITMFEDLEELPGLSNHLAPSAISLDKRCRVGPMADSVASNGTNDERGSGITEGCQRWGPGHLTDPLEKQACRPSEEGKVNQAISSNSGHRRMPSQSFSRPFAGNQPRPSVSHQTPASAPMPSSEFQAQIPIHLDTSNISTDQLGNLNIPLSSTRDRDSNNSSLNRQFLDFGPRKDSDVSFSSGSGTMRYPTATEMAVSPRNTGASSPDEVWKEYDDLIDNVLVPSSSTLSQNLTRNKSEYDNKDTGKSTPKSKHARKGDISFPRLGNFGAFAPPGHLPSSNLGPEKMQRKLQDPVEGVLQSPISGLVAGYADRSSDSMNARNSQSRPERASGSSGKSIRSTSVYSSRSANAPSLTHKRSRSLPENNGNLGGTNLQNGKHRRNSSQNASEDPSTAIFRFRVLMTGKWLSFGRVLFSPAHNCMGQNPDDRILVVDGLGKDWSYFCALTYPNAQVYSLASSPDSASPRSSLGTFQSLSNHRHIAYPGGLSTDFPFPQSFFSTVVFRFPLATSEQNYRNAVSECKRVLRPGGYLEISAMDLDLTNMGHLCRRAVRNLKMSMQRQDANVSLKPASDHLQSLVGRRGFESLNRCIVGVPAAGVLTGSPENSQGDVDFSDLVNDRTAEGDEHITKLVAQVGRWWYSHCYEADILPDGDVSKSMWKDKQLLRECEDLGTTFKLLICYAQKPPLAKRRTVSL